MPPAKKKPLISPRDGAKAKAAAATLAVAALEWISDPKVREDIADQSRKWIKQAQDWRTERKPRSPLSPDEDSPSKPGSLGDGFGQRKLERRVDNLDTSLTTLVSDRPELAEPVAELAAKLNEVRSVLTVAGGLQLVKRKRTHLQIDQRLDQLEEAAVKLAMPERD